jgi:hypothetical protein
MGSVYSDVTNKPHAPTLDKLQITKLTAVMDISKLSLRMGSRPQKFNL